MGKKNKKDKGGNSLVYTTNESGNAFFDSLFIGDEKEESSPRAAMIVRVTRDRKNRGGKEVTLVMGIDLPEDEMKTLGKLLKSKCGVGGAVKDDEIIVQGNHVDKVIELLKKEGFSNTKRTGG